MDLSREVLKYLNEENISMRELARRCDLSPQTISNIVKGVNNKGEKYVPDVETLKKLSTGSNFAMGDLIKIHVDDSTSPRVTKDQVIEWIKNEASMEDLGELLDIISKRFLKK